MERAYKKLLDELIQYFPCVAVIGPRQCGKTTLVRSLGKQWDYFDLEKNADLSIVETDPDLFLSLHSNHVIIDEAQQVPRLFQALRVAIDADRQTRGRFVITGSSSPELLRSISESLAGRVGIIELSPFTLKETLQNHQQPLVSLIVNNNSIDQMEKDLPLNGTPQQVHKHWFNGGYPEPWVEDNDRFTEVWMDNYFATYISRDIKNLFPKMDSSRYRRFIALLAGLSGKTINYSEVARSLDTTPKTIKEYFHIAHGTFLWRNIPPFIENGVKRLVKHPRGFIRDSGLLHYLLRIGSLRDLLVHPSMGLSFEGMVIEEILRSFVCAGQQVDYYYYRTGAGAEVDLVLEGRFGIVPIEIKYGQTVNSRHIKGLKQFVKEHNCPYGIIINNDTRPLRLSQHLISIPFAAI